MEHFDHLTRLLKFTRVVTGTILRCVRHLWLVLFNEAYLCLENLARILVLHLVLVSWLFDRRSELLGPNLIVARHWFWIRNVDKIVFIGILDCQMAIATACVVDPLQQSTRVAWRRIKVNSLLGLRVDEGVSKE